MSAAGRGGPPDGIISCPTAAAIHRTFLRNTKDYSKIFLSPPPPEPALTQLDGITVSLLLLLLLAGA